MKILQSLIIILTSFISICFILNTVVHAEKPVHPDYPYVFDAIGKLDRISNKQLVIDDTLYKLSSSTTYHAPDQTFANPSAFKVKNTVGVILKNKNTREVTSLWLIKRNE